MGPLYNLAIIVSSWDIIRLSVNVQFIKARKMAGFSTSLEAP